MQERDRLTRRWGSAALVGGTLLFGGMAALHPPAVERFPVAGVLEHMLASPLWAPNHWGLLLAMALIGLGLTALHVEIIRRRADAFASFAIASLWVSLTLWVLVFTVEAAGGIPLAAGYAASSGAIAGEALGPVVRGILELIWSAILAVGYVAGAFMSLAVLLWSLDMRRSGMLRPWVQWLGILSGAVLLLALPLGWSFPDTALFWLAPPSAALGVWLLTVGVLMWRLESQRV